jgi:hypothetical protein
VFRVRLPPQPTDPPSLLDEFKSIRSVTAPRKISEYLTSLIGSDAGCVIGTGGSATVSVRRDPDTGKLFAGTQFSARANHHIFIREVEALVQLNHLCVVRIYNWACLKLGRLLKFPWHLRKRDL